MNDDINDIILDYVIGDVAHWTSQFNHGLGYNSTQPRSYDLCYYHHYIRSRLVQELAHFVPPLLHRLQAIQLDLGETTFRVDLDL